MSKSRTNLPGFFSIGGRLKFEPRRGWALKLGLANPESVADHSYRVALMAMVYSDERGLDTGKAMRMALLHDLPEAVVGDSIPGERSLSDKRRLESRAMKMTASELPPSLAKLYLRTWEEFEEGKSPEAKLVRQLDKVEMGFQAAEYRSRYPGTDVKEFLRAARRAVTDRELTRALDAIDR